MTETANEQTTAERIAAALEGLAFETVETRDEMPGVEVSADVLHEALRRLRDDAGFEMITLVTSIDHFPAEPRFEVIHQLRSVQHLDRVRVRTKVSGDAPNVATCVDLWPGAGFMEREVFDLMGVIFTDHPNLRRLLMPVEFPHHPLRKDFPQRGIEPDRLYREWDRERHDDWRPEE